MHESYMDDHHLITSEVLGCGCTQYKHTNGAWWTMVLPECEDNDDLPEEETISLLDRQLQGILGN